VFSRQVLYHLNHANSPFLVLFEISSCFMSGLAWTVILFVLLYTAGMAGMCHHAQILVEMKSPKLFAQAGFKS
jgi:uncharacterized membrane protein YdbT with pleckstrin-like domain